jgi:hypothetical protein
MEQLVLYPAYFLLKCLAYAVWCYYGLRVLRNQSSLSAGLGYGFVRVGLGMVFGVGVFLLAGLWHVGAPPHPWLLYALIYVPVRYVEWSILAALLGAKDGKTHRTGDGATQRWIVQGIVVSHLADIPMILLYSASGSLLPIGRLLC